MNYPKIESKEYLQRVNALRAEMAKRGVDLVVGFSNPNFIILIHSLYLCLSFPKTGNPLLLSIRVLLNSVPNIIFYNDWVHFSRKALA